MKKGDILIVSSN